MKQGVASMMMMTREQQLARHLLVHKAKGYSIIHIIRTSAWLYLIHVVLGTAMLVACFKTDDVSLRLLFMFGFGMFTGALLRDVGWFRRIKKNWPFSQKIMDWAKVEAIAKGEDCQTDTGDGLPAADSPSAVPRE